ncbi:NYN domain-containing protein [Bradyrhizobium pachyrhizi]|uniref:NYN domain-containing protein n=1 Tax=Bradyrhizobium pachyrhizi TaxID=280333 RepID=UPI003D9AF079
MLRAFHYTAIAEDQEYSSIRPLIDWLDYNGYTVVTKATKEFLDASGRRKVKGNMNIALAVDATELAEHSTGWSYSLLTATSVRWLKRCSAAASVISTIAIQPPMIADELRRQADDFIELAQLRPKLERSTERLGHDRCRQARGSQRGIAHAVMRSRLTASGRDAERRVGSIRRRDHLTMTFS